jgi:multidrug efflux pump subunit AcrB
VKLQAFYDQSNWCAIPSPACATPSSIGLILAAIILVLFLRDWGSSIVAGLVIPATIAIT